MSLCLLAFTIAHGQKVHNLLVHCVETPSLCFGVRQCHLLFPTMCNTYFRMRIGYSLSHLFPTLNDFSFLSYIPSLINESASQFPLINRVE